MATEAEARTTVAGDRDVVYTGIDGLDEMLNGGFPRGHAVTVLGPFGTGKTTFALQFLVQGLINGEKGVYISLEEDVNSIVANATGFGWDLAPYLKDRKLSIVKLEPADAKTTATRVRSELPDFIRKFEATRVVIDSISLLNMMFPDERERRTRIFGLVQQVRATGATCVLTAEASPGNERASRDGLVEYISDGVVSLRFREAESGEVQLILQVVKMRRCKHSRRIKPYSIESDGIQVHTEAEVF